MKWFTIAFKRRLVNRRITSFQKRLQREPILPEKVEALFHRLTIIAHELTELGHRYPFILEDIRKDLDRIVSLYGEVISLCQDHEITAIRKQAEHVERKLVEGSHETLAKEVDALRHHITLFCRDNRPSKRGRRIIALAKESAYRADSVLRKQPSAVHALFEKAKEVLDETSCPDPEELEKAEELFEIGYLFYLGKTSEARRAFRTLPGELRKAVSFRLEEQEIFSMDFDTEVLAWQKGLLATAFSLMGAEESGHFFTREEVAAFFKERDFYTERKRAAGCIRLKLPQTTINSG